MKKQDLLYLSFILVLLATPYKGNAQLKSTSQAPTPITASISYQGYDETQAYFGQGEYEIFLDNVNGVLDKPIIILDGFDPGDQRDVTGLYQSLSFDGDNIADIVRDEGFDIVILNAPQYTTEGLDIDGGADYIQRNAMVLIALIDFINEQKEGEEELVILGPSMGGLIARYGLAFMEQNNMPHETRLYISFDSPHRGANIPISLQYLINYLAQQFDNAEAMAIVDQVLNSSAAKEMLYDHLLGHLAQGSLVDQDPTKLLPVGAPDFRDAFQAELDALGFPQNVRNVAMINGSGIGTTTGTPGMQIIDTTLDITPGVTGDVRLNFAPMADETIEVSFFETFVAGISVDTFMADAQSLPQIDGVDAAPGGTSNISNALGDGSGNPVIQDFVDALDQDAFSFIPTISALALVNEEDWFVTPDIGGTHSSPFVNVFIPSQNERHVSVTAESAQFALNEIRNGTLGVASEIIQSRYTLTQNPVSSTIALRLDPSQIYTETQLRVFNLLGQEIIQQTITNPKQEIVIPHSLTTGTYILNITDEFGSLPLKLLVE